MGGFFQVITQSTNNCSWKIIFGVSYKRANCDCYERQGLQIEQWLARGGEGTQMGQKEAQREATRGRGGPERALSTQARGIMKHNSKLRSSSGF